MKKRIGVSLISVLVLFSLLLSGCSFGKSKVVWSVGLLDRQLFKIEDEKCSLGQGEIVLANYINNYSEKFGKKLWSTEKAKELESYLKDTTLSQLAKMTCMSMLADKEKVVLSKQEKKNVVQASEVYYKSLSKKEVDFFQVTQEEILELYERYALATKMYTQLTGGVNEEVSDDDARVVDVLQIFVKSKETAEVIGKKLEQGGEFKNIANYYNETDSIEVSYGRMDLPIEVEEKIFAMNDDEISEEIPTKDGYLFIQCISKLNREKTEANKKIIVEQRAMEAFDDVYHTFIKDLKTEYNSKTWKEVTLSKEKEVTTASFFQTFEKYCGSLAGK
ncbi:MAG: peptidyl-prolyl cis-trans isomerase [Lachnospiraceae bacterium]